MFKTTVAVAIYTSAEVGIWKPRERLEVFVILDLFYSLLFCGFSGWLIGFGLGLFSISTVLPVILISWLYFQYILFTLFEFLAIHPSSVASQI